MQPIAHLVLSLAGERGTVLALVLLILPLLLLLQLIQFYQLARLKKRYKSLLGGQNGEKNTEEILLKYLTDTQLALSKVEKLKGKLEDLEGELECCLQKMGIVRYNAFPDAAGDLSFALALLDAKGDGVVLSSLYGRHESRIYGKPILRGTSPYLLTHEEREAIEKAGKKESN